MAYGHGKDAVFWLDNATGTITNYTTYVKSVSLKQSAEVGETTTMGDASKEFLAGLKDGTISIEGVYEPTMDTALNAALGAQKSFEIGPQGGGSGAVKYSGECLCTSYTPAEASVDDVVTFSAEFQITGAVTKGTFA